jgi:phosphoribosylformimino-5-aminoimidazole carboxamide ribotide isomerase
MPRHEPRFQLIPAVDVLDTEAVRLVQGDYDDISFRSPDPSALVRDVVAAGADFVHVVDLSGARSGHVRPELFRQVVAAAGAAQVQASGGVRTLEDAEALVAAGAARVVVGTAAFGDDDLLDGLSATLGERLVVAIDVREGVVAVRGWEASTGLTVERAVDRCVDAGVSRLLCTAIERDGTLAGPALPLLEQVVRHAGLPVLAAGGVRSLEDVEAIAGVGCEGAIVGRALLEGRLPLAALGSHSI